MRHVCPSHLWGKEGRRTEAPLPWALNGQEMGVHPQPPPPPLTVALKNLSLNRVRCSETEVGCVPAMCCFLFFYFVRAISSFQLDSVTSFFVLWPSGEPCSEAWTESHCGFRTPKGCLFKVRGEGTSSKPGGPNAHLPDSCLSPRFSSVCTPSLTAVTCPKTSATHRGVSVRDRSAQRAAPRVSKGTQPPLQAWGPFCPSLSDSPLGELGAQRG